MFNVSNWLRRAGRTRAQQPTTRARRPRQLHLEALEDRWVPSSTSVDVLFLTDTTGSMGSYITGIRSAFGGILTAVASSLPGMDIAYGVADYRDYRDGGNYQAHGVNLVQSFTTDRTAAQTAIDRLQAGGGNDPPESNLKALQSVATNWTTATGPLGFAGRADAQKLVVWAGDQPGHVAGDTGADGPADYYPTLAETLMALQTRGVKVIGLNTSSQHSGIDQFYGGAYQESHLTSGTAGTALFNVGSGGPTIEHAVVSSIVNLAHPNDTFATAYNLGTMTGRFGSANLELSSGQYQYYSFTTTATAGPASQVVITTAQPTTTTAVELYLFDQAGNLLDRSTVAGATQQSVALNGLPAGTYTFLVYTSGPYNLFTFLIDTAPGTQAPADSYEINNTPATAADLGTLTAAQTFSGLSLLDHYDYFRFTLAAPGGGDSSLQVAATQPGADPLGLGLYLYNAAGDLLDLRTPPAASAQIPLNNLPAGTYTVLVYGLRASPAYTLTLDPGTTAPVADDSYAPNGTPAVATDLGALYGRLTLTGLNLAASRDLYRFAIPFAGNAASEVRLRTDPAQGAVGLYLLGADGSVLATTRDASGNQALTLRGRPAGTYYALVTEGMAQDYTLVLDPGLGPYPDDTYESGDTLDTAADLGTLSSATTLDDLVMSDTYDLFRFTTTATGGAASGVLLTTDQGRGLLDLYLFDGAGAILAFAPGEVALAPGSGTPATVTRLPLTNRPAGTYGVLVLGRTGANPRYSLTIDPTAADPLLDDTYEPDNLPATAADLGTLSTNLAVTGLVLADQYDFYRFTLTNPGPAAGRVTVTPAAPVPYFDLYLFDATGSLVTHSLNGTARNGSASGRLALAARPAGTYTLLVYAPGPIADYRLDFTMA